MAARTEAVTIMNLGHKWTWFLDDVTFKAARSKEPKIVIFKNVNLKHTTQNKKERNCTQFKTRAFSLIMEINFISFPLRSSPLFISHLQLGFSGPFHSFQELVRQRKMLLREK